MTDAGFSPAGGLLLIGIGLGVVVYGRRLGWFAALLPLPAMWLLGAGLAQFPLFAIQRPWSGRMWLLVTLVPLAFALGALVGSRLVGTRPAWTRRLHVPPAGARLRWLLTALFLVGVAELAHQFAGAGGIPLLAERIDDTRFAQPQGASVVLIDLLVVVAIVALTLPPRLTARACRFELLLGLLAIGGLALQASRGAVLLPLATIVVARAMVWGLPRREVLTATVALTVVGFCGLFYLRVSQHSDGAFERDLLDRVLPGRRAWERPVVPLYVALAPNFEVLRGLVEHFPNVEPFAHGRFSTVAFDRIVPGTRIAGDVAAQLTPPFTAPTFAGSLWADGGFALVWLAAAALGAVNAAVLRLAVATRALAWRLIASYLVVLTAFAIYDNFFTQYLDWLLIAPGLLLVGSAARPAPEAADA